MKKPRLSLKFSKGSLPIIGALVLVIFLMIYKLGSLVGGFSNTEMTTANTAVGWHGVYHDPFYLPLKLVQSLIFFVYPNHGQALTRLPETVFGLTAVVAFYLLIRVWHGRRTAILATILFLSSAWTLHVSRFAGVDVMYLWALPVLMLTNLGVHKRPENGLVVYGSMLIWSSMLYIPGMIWLLGLNFYLLAGDMPIVWKSLSRLWKRIIYILVGAAWLPLLVIGLSRAGSFKLWLGLPSNFAGLIQIAKNFGLVFVHIFVHGPDDPQLWLGKAPVLDVFALIMFMLGLYFYVRHFSAFRPRMLAVFGLFSIVLISLGVVGFSLIVPLLYMIAAAGIAYLLHEWLQVFPVNPLARGVGLGLIFLAVGLASIYNLRSYFIAWPHNPSTPPTFHYRR